MTVRVRVTLENQRQVQRSLALMDPETNTRIKSEALTRGGLLLQADVKAKRIRLGAKDSKPIPGMLTDRHHIAGLWGSIVVARQGLPKFVEVGSAKSYARIHELGGTMASGGLMPPRPYLAPALKANRKRLETILAEVWGEHVKRAAPA